MGRFVGFMLLVLVSALLVGCAEAPEPVEQPAGEEQPVDAEPEVPRADSLHVAVPVDAGPVNIFGQHEEWLTELVYDKLLAPSPYTDEPQPWLAESVTQIDPSTWEVTVRPDVTWHDGEAFSAEDVAFTVAYFRHAPTGRWTHHVDEVPDFTAEVVDETVARLMCAYPCPDLGPVTLADIPILPEHVWSDVDEPQERTELPVGTGPYELVDYDGASGYRFEANDDFFAGRPAVDELVMPVIADPSTTFTALRSGDLDAAARPVSPELVADFEADDALEVVATAPLWFPELRLNYEEEPFDRGAFRQAVSLAMDRDELLESVMLGQGRPSDSGYPHPDSPWTNPALSTPSDPERARALLDELDFVDRTGDGVRQLPDGSPIAFELKVNGSEPTDVRAGELIVEHLGEVGLDATLRQLDPGTMGDLFSSRDFEAYIGAIGAHGVADPTQFIMSHRSGYAWDWPRVPYPEWEQLWEQWQAADTVDERAELSFEMQVLFNEHPTLIPLYYPDEHWAFDPDAYDGWVEARGYGIVHKWSLLPRHVVEEVGAVVSPR